MLNKRSKNVDKKIWKIKCKFISNEVFAEFK